MILGLSHVAIGCRWGKSFATNYKVPSSKLKWPLLAMRPLYHDLVVNFPGKVPIELVNYETGLVDVPTRIRIAGAAAIEVRARDVEREKKFLAAFGRVHAKSICVSSQVKKWRTDIFLREDSTAPLDPPLDVAGYAAIAFYTTDIDEELGRLVELGGRDSTGKFELGLNGRQLEVCMLRSPEGTIVELIRVCNG